MRGNVVSRLGYFAGLGQDEGDEASAYLDMLEPTPVPVIESTLPGVIPYTPVNYTGVDPGGVVQVSTDANGVITQSYTPSSTPGVQTIPLPPNTAAVTPSLATALANSVSSLLSPRPSPTVASTPTASSFLTQSSLVGGVPNIAVLFGIGAVALLMMSGGSSGRRR